MGSGGWFPVGCARGDGRALDRSRRGMGNRRRLPVFDDGSFREAGSICQSAVARSQHRRILGPARVRERGGDGKTRRRGVVVLESEDGGLAVARYEEIIGGSWEQSSVFPESIPHLFHHDMAYLWVLEQQKDQRPRTWLTRVEAWKVLLRLFLLDQVTINAVELLPPLKEVAERFGLSRVTWLRSKESKQPIGVLSSTVIVRPLPDFTDSDAERWRSELKDNEKEFNH